MMPHLYMKHSLLYIYLMIQLRYNNLHLLLNNLNHHKLNILLHITQHMIYIHRLQ